VSINFTWF
jgi:hypothetical protein